MKLGLIINPIAGMGGRVGLKGTDGRDILEEARRLGSIPEAEIKAQRALEQLLPVKDQLTLYVAQGAMGSDSAEKLGFNYQVIYHPEAGDTDQHDTFNLAQALSEEQVDLILFVGGDGTARDVSRTIGTKVPAIGIPAGVKIHSPVYGMTPESAGKLALEFVKNPTMPLKDDEVMDIEEEAFRRDEIVIEVYGYLKVPQDPTYLQPLKSPSPQSDASAMESAALYIIDEMEDDTIYIVGSGTTTAQIMQELGLEHTILGVDIIKDRQLLVKDAAEKEIIEAIDGESKVKLIITPMGGQGYIFGRGNQQLSANVLRRLTRQDVIIIATPNKLLTIGSNPFLVYTLDDEIDQAYSGYYKVITGYGQIAMKKAASLK
ncbi:ATP-NAD kinase family protein [Falseniella ignava]|uniref:ATP-NAD kinase n=1 Tax=Falseniella ignava CCUG 37419 TaxID=883112 RepID=K1LUF3_9LACT|nr:ATP-NAD kinase family protein [Falseniella ignava]EKB53648.1 hypothetical protein HMPREF9707_01401 [Falseniella ignava CCUG 37419]